MHFPSCIRDRLPALRERGTSHPSGAPIVVLVGGLPIALAILLTVALAVR